MQRNWIGRSEGLPLRFALDGKAPAGHDEIEVYTTRPDTLYGAVVPRHRRQSPARPRRRRRAIRRSPPSSQECHRGGTSAEAIETQEKMGFDTGLRAEHPLGAGLDAARLCRELHPDGLRHRRHLRLPGA